MAQAQADPPAAAPPTARVGGGYRSAEDGLKAVGGWFRQWSERLAGTSVQLSYALVAANWAVFGSVDKLLENPAAKASISLVVLFLGTNLALTRVVTDLLRRQYSRAEADPVNWAREFERTKGTVHPWPSSTAIDSASRLLREARTWLPLAAGGAFLLALFS